MSQRSLGGSVRTLLHLSAETPGSVAKQEKIHGSGATSAKKISMVFPLPIADALQIMVELRRLCPGKGCVPVERLPVQPQNGQSRLKRRNNGLGR